MKTGKTFVRVTTAAAVGALLGVASTTAAMAADKIEWNMSTFGPPRVVTVGYETVAKYIEEKSGGNFTMKIHYAESISPVKNHLDGMKIGALDAAHFCMSYHPGKNPVGTVLDLPFLPIPDIPALIKTHEEFRTYEPWVKEMERWNALTWFTAALPLYEFMGGGTPPRELKDWNGMRVRALGGIGDAMRKLGAVPTTVPAPEVYTSMERGVVQAASFPFSYAHAAYRLHEIGKWYTANMAIGSIYCPQMMGKAAYEKLSPEYRKLIDEAREVAHDKYLTVYDEADEKWIPIYDRTLERITYSEDQLAEFRKIAAEPVWNEWVAKMKTEGVPNSREVLDFVLQAAKRATGSS